ncbi:MAG: 30S ribosomal protein S4 [Elusimicrobiota bacterium]|jgi:small subunit ribosomal protein S4|nr:30S ribosomal protein S4 [Elusimicrobiota bacterium]
MSKYTGPSCKKCRKLSQKLFLKGAKCYSNCVMDKLAAVAKKGRGGPRKPKLSEYGVRLMEKQKAKFISGMTETPFANLFHKAGKATGQTGEQFLKYLETRLDNIVKRAGFASSLRSARQLVLHGHIKVNDKAVNVPSYQVKPGDKVTLVAKLADNVNVKQGLEDAQKRTLRPSFLEFDASKNTATLLRWPDRSESSYPVNDQLIVEHYSK